MSAIAAAKAQFFRILGHPARVRLLEALLDGEHSVGELQTMLALDSSGVSQHLTALRREGLLESRREGTSVIYRIRDPRTAELLDVARAIIRAQVAGEKALLDELAGAGGRKVAG